MSRRRTRPSASRTPLVRNGFGQILCRWCQKPATKKLGTFCSKKCVFEWKIRTSQSFARKAVFARDKGVCANCGLDTEKLRRQLEFLSPEVREAKLSGMGFHPNRALWEMDHIVEVRDGGGQCGLDNYQSLCWACHNKKTYRRNVL